MTHRERFNKLFSFQQIDRMPVYFFGTWSETRMRWANEGFSGKVVPHGDYGPQLDGMDPEWEPGLWNEHGIVQVGPIGDQQQAVLEDLGNGTKVVRSSLGKIERIRTDGTSIPTTLQYPLEPTRRSWNHFMKFFDTKYNERYSPDWETIADTRNTQDIVTCFLGGSFYGWLRDYMGVTNLSYLQYDDPDLLEEMIETIADHMIRLTEPMLNRMKFDFAYFFEDCCGSNGPLFSPKIYREIFDRHYQRLIRFYKDHGVPLTLIDSDGYVDPLIPCWLESGFDILFPIEVGKWGANPSDIRRKYGNHVCMMGGVNKHLIASDESKLREHLLSQKPETDRGGFLPIPDHRIPPEVSYHQMQRYIQIFNEVFNA